VKFDDLAAYVPEVERLLRKTYRDELSRAPPRVRPHIELLEEFTLRGGKRMRALLVLAGFHLATQRAPDPALPVAAALEHFQSWMLVHDDLIDHSDVRRGGPTLHRQLEGRHRESSWAGTSESYGVGMGITLGDLEEPFTVGAILGCKVAPARRLRALEEYVRMTRLTAYGQVLDIENALAPVGDVRELDVLLVHQLKSAVYSVAGPLRIGALLGGAADGLVAALEEFGLATGVAFQLRDDVLGAGLSLGDIGKSSNDLVEGKRTLLLVRAWHTSNAEGHATISKVLGNPAATAEEIAAAKQVLVSSGSLAHSERRIAELQERAARPLKKSGSLTDEGRALLQEIGDRLLYRTI